MKSVSNKTQRPIGIPLPRGKVLHLGPGKTGQIASNAVEHPRFKQLIAEGAIEVVDVGPGQADALGRGYANRRSVRGHVPGGGSRRSGDR